MAELNFFLIALIVVAWAVAKAVHDGPKEDDAGLHLANRR
jgi:hypothetical protein